MTAAELERLADLLDRAERITDRLESIVRPAPAPARDLAAEVLDVLGQADGYLTGREVAVGVKVARARAEETLDRLVALRAAEKRASPPGRSTLAVGYRPLVSTGLETSERASRGTGRAEVAR